MCYMLVWSTPLPAEKIQVHPHGAYWLAEKTGLHQRVTQMNVNSKQ